MNGVPFSEVEGLEFLAEELKFDFGEFSSTHASKSFLSVLLNAVQSSDPELMGKILDFARIKVTPQTLLEILRLNGLEGASVVRNLLNVEANVPFLLNQFQTFQHELLEHEGGEMIELFASTPEMVNARINLRVKVREELEGRTGFQTVRGNPLHLAILRKDLLQMQKLIELGADVDGVEAMPPVIFCLCTHDPSNSSATYSMLGLLIQHGADCNRVYASSEYMSQRTALLRSCLIDDLHIVDQLVSGGADLGLHNLDCLHPLIFAIYKMSSNIFQYLIRNGADLNHYFPRDDCPAFKEFFHPEFCWASPIHMAIRIHSVHISSGVHFPFLDHLIRSGADVNLMRNNHLPPPLGFLICTLSGIVDVAHYVTLFTEHGVDPSQGVYSTLDTTGQPTILEHWGFEGPLYWAMREEDHECFVKLLEHGADPNIMIRRGMSMIHVTLDFVQSDAKNRLKFLETLLDFGADPNQMCLCVCGNTNALKLYLTYDQNLVGPRSYQTVVLLISHDARLSFSSLSSHPFGILGIGTLTHDVQDDILDILQAFSEMNNAKDISCFLRCGAARLPEHVSLKIKSIL